MLGTKLFSALPVAVYTIDAEGFVTYYNDAAARLWGQRPELGTTKWCGAWRLYAPDGSPLVIENSAIALTLKTGKPVHGSEAVIERPDGTKVPFSPFPSPLIDDQGRVVGAMSLLVEHGDREQAALESARLAAIVAYSNDAIVSKTLEGRITSWNAAAARMFGWAPDEMIGQSILKIIPPELHHEEHYILERLRRGDHIEHFETVRVGRDGRRIHISLSVSPLRDSTGRIAGVSKIARDITERKEADRLQRLLIEELNHRVKNTLATVQAIANQSLSRARNSGDFVASFGGRVRALAKAHDLLTQTRMRGSDMIDLMREQVMLGARDDPRISCTGPALLLNSQMTVQLGLVLHELAINARKYGALSVPQGRLRVSWEVRANPGRCVHLHWREAGGPPVASPRTAGFGTTLITQTIKSRGGEVSLNYRADGLTCDIVIPLPDSVEPDFGAYGAAALERTVAPGATPNEKRTLMGKRVLIVEDEPIVAMDLEATLQGVQCEVLGPASTLANARALVAAGGFDAALVDVNLAGQPVDELAHALTQKAIPFAFVTGYGREALPRGFGDAVMLGKPFDSSQVEAVLELLLAPRTDVLSLRPKS